MSQTAAVPVLPNYIGGEAVPSKSGRKLPVYSPTNGELIAEVPMSTNAELDVAVRKAAEAQVAWGQMPMKNRVQILFRLKTIMEEQADSLAEIVSRENGKTVAEAHGSVSRAIECVEFATSLPQIAAGQVQEVSRGVECKMLRYPLGGRGHYPFNFPLMVPMWMIPLAIGCGNAFILKPSEQTPLGGQEIARLLDEAGLPKGIFSVVNGDREIVEGICDHPLIQAIGFVGSSKVAKLVFERGSKNGKRVKALGGAKNHLVVVPDADPAMTIANVVASATGCAGQRCMAASVLLAVGEVDHIIDGIRKKFSEMRAGVDVGAVISTTARERITGYIARAKEQGGHVSVDGRDNVSPDAPKGGNYLGPTLIENVPPSHEAACDEIFGPTLTIIRCKTLEEAMKIENANPYGNAAAIYTSSGQVATYFIERAQAGMIGVNIGVPVPREPFPFGGWHDSSYGAGDLTGHGAHEFWTRTKKITTKWSDEHRSNWMS